MRLLLLLGGVLALGIGVLYFGIQPKAPSEGNVVASVETTVGETLFNTNFATCHGAGATGTDQGPPLVHPIYEPSHHGDSSFQMAVKNGSPAHHWPFGDMPPVAGVSEQDVAQIIAYVRSLQVAAGIH